MEEAEQTYETSRYEGIKDDFNSMVLRLDPTPTLKIIRRNLLMETILEDDGKYHRIKGLEPKFKEEGIEELMNILYARMSVDKVLSNLNENSIRLTVREIGEVVIEWIYSNSKKYYIKECDFNDIHYMIKHNIEIFLRRAKDGKENELITKSFISRETVNKQTRAQEYSENKNNGWGFRR